MKKHERIYSLVGGMLALLCGAAFILTKSENTIISQIWLIVAAFVNVFILHMGSRTAFKIAMSFMCIAIVYGTPIQAPNGLQHGVWIVAIGKSLIAMLGLYVVNFTNLFFREKPQND